jgi:acyl-CoA synthetase (AMP-forming)/AMP-acid ligase II
VTEAQEIDAAPAVPAAGTVPSLLWERAGSTPDTAALVFPGAQLTYAELAERASVRARQLLGLGLTRGDAIGLLMPNSQVLVEFLFGAAVIGVATIPVNVRFKSRELAHVLGNGMQALIASDEMMEHVDLVGLVCSVLPELESPRSGTAELNLPGAPELKAAILLGERRVGAFLTEAELEAGAAPATSPIHLAEPGDPVLIMYTSGTTALPKGCIVEHGSLTANARAVAARFGLTPGERFWDPMPMYHLASLLPLCACVAAAATYIGMSHFEADLALEMLARERPAVIYSCFPPVTMAIMHHPRFAELRPHSARIVANIAPPDTQRLVAEAFAPARLVGAYGMTELCGTLCYHGLEDTDEQRLHTCGAPMPGNEVRILSSETGLPLPPGKRGEIVVRGLNRLPGYFRDEEHTRAAIDADGFFHTGDIGSLDRDGHLSYHGRLKDMLKVGGENVAALEVEDLIATLPGVKLVQVVGIADPRLTEVPAAFIELGPGHSLSGEDVIAYCRERIASFKVPRHVRFVTEWPMSATKIQKYRLAERLESELASTASAATQDEPST